MPEIRTIAILSVFVTQAFAANRSGALVDSKCYAAEERNVNPTDTLTGVDRDRNLEIRFCAPREKTRLFSLVLADATGFGLDSCGNGKAADLVRGTKEKTAPVVSVAGEVRDKRLQVRSMSLIR